MRILIPFFILIWLAPALSSELENRAQFLTTLHNIHDGPNCWNSSMIVLGAVDHFRFLHLSEFEYYLRNYCSPLKKTEDLSYGNLIVESEVVQSSLGEIEHSFIYFSQDKAFGKDSPDPMDKPRFASFPKAFVFSDYKDFNKPPGGSTGIGQPYSCNFSTKPIVPKNIKAIMELFHKIHTSETPLTEEIYQNLITMADNVSQPEGEESRYARVLMLSIRKQIEFYSKALGHN